MRTMILTLAAAGALVLGGCSGDSATPAESSAAPGVTVTDAYIAQPASDTSAMFGIVTNNGGDAVKITGGSAPDVGMVQVHEFVSQGSTEVMKQVEGGLEVPAGGSVTLQPGGYHVMLMDVTADWQVGDEVTVTLNLSDGQSVAVTAPVKAREGMTSGEGSMDMSASPSS